jgi:hypothetical protein
VVTIDLEDAVQVRLEACSKEDERRLCSWFRKTGALRHLEAVVALMLDDLDAHDERKAA